HPANQFVAGFIGSPPINLFTATVRAEGPLALETGGKDIGVVPAGGAPPPPPRGAPGGARPPPPQPAPGPRAPGRDGRGGLGAGWGSGWAAKPWCTGARRPAGWCPESRVRRRQSGRARCSISHTPESISSTRRPSARSATRTPAREGGSGSPATPESRPRDEA